MFSILKNLANYVWKPSEGAENLFQSNGVFYKQRDNGQWECIIPNCTITLQKSTEHDFAYSLIFEEPSEDSEDEEEDEERKSWYWILLSENANFRECDRPDGTRAFSYMSDDQENFMFEFESCDDTLFLWFVVSVGQYVFEHETQSPAEQAPKSEVEKYFELLDKEALNAKFASEENYNEEPSFNEPYESEISFVKESESDSDEYQSDKEENEESDDSGYEEDFDEGISLEDNKDNEKNSSLAVGHSSNRSFVVRGNKIGVFKSDNNKLELDTTISGLKNSQGNTFSPAKVMLHQQDQSMLMLNPSQRNQIFKMDLERPDIVEEWNASEEYPITSLIPESKYSQTTNTPTLLGVNSLGYCTIDTRVGKVVQDQSFFYEGRSRPSISAAATTGQGHLAIGTKKGDIRLFDGKTVQTPEKNALNRKPKAKTNLPGFGDPITAMDVSEDGLWILVTCKTYLMVVPTSLADGSTGFEKSMGKEKPKPKRLQLSNDHVQQLGGDINFTPAKFNTSIYRGKPESSIVTSTGAFLITWNFKKVKQNRLQEYQVKMYRQNIIADEFMFGQDKNIVVTFENNVQMASKTK